MQLGAVNQYDQDNVVGILNGAPIPKRALENEEGLSREIAIFLLFISDVNTGAIG